MTKRKVEADREMNLHHDHPILLLLPMLCHEGYHHGQMKLALKLAGRPIIDEQAGPVTRGRLDAKDREDVMDLAPRHLWGLASAWLSS